MKGPDGKTWLESITDMAGSGGNEIFGSIVLLAIIVGFVFYAVKEPSKPQGSGGSH